MTDNVSPIISVKNIVIHLIDMVHHYIFNHYPPQLFKRWYLFGACDTLCESSWWSCDNKDWYCKRFDWGDDDG